jgi:hypothetical protein
MSEEPRNEFRYQILRYTPNLIRDEWVNIGVLLERTGVRHDRLAKRAIRVVEDPSELARVRRLHPRADEGLLRALPMEFDLRLRDAQTAPAAYLEKLGDTLSNVLQFSPPRALLADDFDAELDRLYRAHVALPRRSRGTLLESTRAWIKQRINDVFLRRGVPKLERNIRVEDFTEPGDPLKLDYGYRNGVRGFLHALALGRDPAQAKILAYTAERVRIRLPGCEFTAITESEPSHDSRRHQFIARLFADENIGIVPLSRIDRFAEDLRLRLR